MGCKHKNKSKLPRIFLLPLKLLTIDQLTSKRSDVASVFRQLFSC